LSGYTEVNEALLTGESRPIVKRCGDDVIAGSINLSQVVEVEVTKDPDESTVSVMGRMLLKSQTHKSRYARLSERYAGWFVAVVLTVSGLTALWWLTHDVTMLFPATLAVLVISCPCALSLATPAAIASASRALLEHGVLLTRGAALETLGGIDMVVFDKTGTLTTGLPLIMDTTINPARESYDEVAVLHIAALLEIDSSHPVSRAFADVQVSRDDVSDVVNHENGVEGRVDGFEYKLGNAAFTNVNVTDLPNAGGKLWLADQSGWIARFDLDDGLREGAAHTMAALKARGLDLMILSGDHPHLVASVAERVRIEKWHAEQNPKMKMELLEFLQARGRRVLMVGDGINDAPVLSAATVSMTVSGASELANSTADFILTSNSLALVEDVFASAAQTRKAGLQSFSRPICRRRVDRAMDGCPWHVTEFSAGGVKFRSPCETKDNSSGNSINRSTHTMTMLYVLIPLAVVLLAVAVWAMLWAIKTGQFDDLDSHGWSVVLDDDQKPPPIEDDEFENIGTHDNNGDK